MGGNAFKGITVRLEREEYDVVCLFMHLKLSNYPIDFRITKSYVNKKNFGDLDIIYTLKDPSYNFVDEYLRTEHPQHSFKNGDVLSVTVNTESGPFQVDFIRVEEKTFNFSYHYFNYNDLGNFLGRIFHKAGFKLGHNGLRYVLRVNNTNVIREILVTPYWLSAMQFMGYEKYFSTQFYNVEDLFQFALSSPYSNKDIFLLDNLNHKNRIRDRKRKNYSLLLNFLNDPETKCANFDWSNKEELRQEFLEKAFKKWPSFEKEYHEAIQEYEKKKDLHSKFNGRLVADVTGLEGKELGAFITKFKHTFGDQFENLVLTSSEFKLKKLIQFFYEIEQVNE